MTFTVRLPAVGDDIANRLTLVGETPYQREANGNLVNDGASAYGHSRPMATCCDLFDIDSGRQALRQLARARTGIDTLGRM